MSKTRNTYFYPVDKKFIVKKDSPAHIVHNDSKDGAVYDLRHAVDFGCPEGTNVCAALSGKIVFVKTDVRKAFSGEDKMLHDDADGNFVVIKHDVGEYSKYCHLKHGEIKVKHGQEVSAGNLIALSGHTGWSLKPHLHFEVFKTHILKKGYSTLEVNWAD